MIIRPFTLGAPGGGRIDGDVRLPAGPPPRAAVVVVHGFKGFKDWGFFPHVATELAVAGYAAVSFNFSRNGVTSTAPTEFTDLEAFASNTLSRELAELDQVIDATLGGQVTGRPLRRLGLLGHSRGGGMAILAAALDTRVHALATWGAVATFDRWSDETVREWREAGRLHVLNSRTGQQMPLDVGLLDDFEANRAALDVTAAAAGIRVPWLIVHGEQDLTVRPDDAHRLVEASKNARLVFVEGAGHTFNAPHPLEDPPRQLVRAVQATVSHLREHLAVD